VLTFCLQQALGLVLKNPDEASIMARTYQSDGWNVFVSPHSVTTTDALTICRTGKAKLEFLLEFGVTKTYNNEGDVVANMSMPPARPLQSGTDCFTVFSACCDMWPLPRECGYRGYLLSVYIQDGLFAKTFGGYAEARHALWYKYNKDDFDEDELWALEQKEIIVACECKLHIGARAVKWAHKRLSDEQILEDCHVALKGLVSTSAVIRERLPAFLDRAVRFNAGELLPWEDMEKRWELLGVDIEKMELLRWANPRWCRRRQKLFVDPRCEEHPDCMKKLLQVYEYSFSWTNFIESRFAGVGTSARQWLLSDMLGLDTVIDEVKADRTVSKAFLNNYNRCSQKVRLFFVVAAFSYSPIEEWLTQLMEDDRFYKHFESSYDQLIIDMNKVCEVPIDFLQEVVNTVGLTNTAQELQNEIAVSMHISCGFFYAEACREMWHLPHSLLRGDIYKNVQDLAAMPGEPSDPVSRRLWHSMNSGAASEASTVNLCKLWADTSATTINAEQGHGHGERVGRRHTGIDATSIAARSVASRSITLVQQKRHELQMQKLARDIDKLENTKRRKRTARNEYCAQLVQDRDPSTLADADETWAACSDIVSRHNADFDALPVEEKLALQMKAQETDRFRETADRLRNEEMRNTLSILEARHAPVCGRIHGVANSLTGLRFTDAQMETLAEAWGSSDWRGDELERDWEASVSSPTPLPDVAQHEILDMQKKLEAAMPDIKKPWWAPYISLYRDEFASSAVALSFDEHEDHIYRFLYAKKNPVYSVFIRAKRRTQIIPPVETLAAHESCYDAWLYEYDFDMGTYCLDSDMPSGDGNIYVLQNTHITSNATIEVRRQRELLEDWMRMLPPKPKLPTEKDTTRPLYSQEFIEKIREEFPWITDEDLGIAVHGRKTSHTETAAGHKGAAVPKKMTEIDEEHARAVTQELLLKRDEWISELPDENFYIHLPGGRWTKENKRVISDQAICYGRAHTATFTRTYQWPRQKGFAFNKFSGEENSNALAQAWQDKGHFYYTLWMEEAKGDEHFQFTDDHVDLYQPRKEFLDWALANYANDTVWNAAQECIRARPTNPVA